MSDSDYSLYLVRCADGSLYTGIAIDVEKRMREHDRGTRGAKYLRGRGPLRLVFEQRIGGRSLASHAEHRVKGLDRGQKEALIAGETSLAELLSNADQASGTACG